MMGKHDAGDHCVAELVGVALRRPSRHQIGGLLGRVGIERCDTPAKSLEKLIERMVQ